MSAAQISDETNALFSELITSVGDYEKQELITEEVRLQLPDEADNSDETGKILDEAYKNLYDLNINQAKRLFEKVITSANRKFMSSALYGLGECFFVEHEYQKAYKMWQQLAVYQDSFTQKAKIKLLYLQTVLNFAEKNLYTARNDVRSEEIEQAERSYAEKDYEESCLKCLKMLKKDPENIYALFQLAVNYRAMRTLGNSLKKMDYVFLEKQQYEKILELTHFPYAYNNLGILYMESGDFNKAADYFKKAVKYDEIGVVSETARNNLYSVMKRGGKFSDEEYMLE